MRNRANASPIPTPPEPSPIPPYVPPKRSKYDDLVDVLADGLFEMVLNDDAPVPIPRKRRRGVPRA
ncbi:MAG: hypothetical protein IPG50_28255 [Myxococcales bacterium]|nr:hypothetical protein [Myxococcales bacterium]